MALPKVVANVIRAVAPTLALALPGPLGMVASALVTGALKVFLPVGPDGTPPAAATPEQIAQAVRQHAGDPELVKALAAAEKTLADYERDNNFRFAELEVKDREGARAFARDSGTANRAYSLGWSILAVDAVTTIMAVGGGFVVLYGAFEIRDQNVLLAVFTLLGGIVGRISARADTFVNFVFGSSQGSRDKSVQISDTVADLGAALADAPQRAPAAPPVPPSPPPVVVVPPVAVPTPAPVPAPPVVEGPLRQGPFGGQRWRLTPQGVVLEGDTKPLRTVGQPATVRRIWRDFGPFIAASCATHGVPLELVVATIATESRGVVKAKLVEPDARMSLGLMQLLTGTAEMVAGRPVSPDELYDPATNIDLGTRYIASQRRHTDFQPPLVASAYNAGSLRKAREQDDNAFNLRSTGDHIHRLCQYFGDSCAVAVEENWSHQGAAAASPSA